MSCLVKRSIFSPVTRTPRVDLERVWSRRRLGWGRRVDVVAMDPQTVVQALGNTLNPELRQQAENFLEEVGTLRGLASVTRAL